jgi:tetratricopeptide (TPR) repeat protein
VTDPTPTDSSGLQPRLQEASQLSDEGRWDEAFEILLEEEPDHPRDATLLCMLGVAAEEVGAAGMAYDFFRRCLAEQPTDPFLLVPLGGGLARYDDPDAEGVLRLAALSAPDLAMTRLQYGAYLAREGQLELALAELEAARGLDAGDPQIARELGAARFAAGQREEGLEELERAVDMAEDEGEIRLVFGLALVQAARPDEAAEHIYRAALDLAADGEVQLLSALSCGAQEWWDQAWDALARADHSEFAADPLLKAEVEEALEAGSEECEALLREELAPSMFRARLLEQP